MAISQMNKLVLKSLENGDKYGLEIIKDVEEFTNGKTILKQPTLYSALQRLEKKGLVTSLAWQDSDIGGRRHYYSLTNYGKSELHKAMQEDAPESINPFEKKSPPTLENFDTQDNFVKTENEKQNTNIISKPILKTRELKTVDVDTTPVFTEKSTPTFEQYNPKNITQNNSFSSKMREYAEPDTSIFEKTPSFVEKEQNNSGVNPIFTSKNNDFLANTTNFNNNLNENKTPTFAENNSNLNNNFIKDDINYKDILGDLDADIVESNDKPTPNIFSSQEIKPIPTPQIQPTRKQTEYSKQIEKILNSDTEQTNKKSPEEIRQTQNLMEEVNKRYNLNYNKYSKNKVLEPASITKNQAEYSHIKQDNITVKTYNKSTTSSKPKDFLNINKFKLYRAILMSLLFAGELFLAYYLLDKNNLLYEKHVFTFYIYGGLCGLYLIIMLSVTLSNIHKKIRLKDINWGINFFYRFITICVLVTLVLAICLALGMTKPLQIDFLTLWILPAIAIANIFISWLIGLFMYATKMFRVR